MLDFLVLNDAPDRASSRIQIAKTGVFKDPRYGTFRITSKDFSKWIANFTDLHKSNGHLGLPIDVDHKPETTGNTEAAGWITSLSIEADGTELWAVAEWNDVGKELIANRRYAYISPSYVANYKDETGKEHGTALIGVALTNRPFLSMATVSLSRLHTTTSEAYTPTEMPISKKLLDALKLSEDADEATVLTKIDELTTKPEPQNKTLADMAKAEGMMILSATDYATLAKNAAEGAAASISLKEQRFENAFDKALSDPKGARVLPAQKDNYKTLFEADADTCISLIESLPNLVTATPVGSAGEGAVGASLSRDEVEDFGVDEDMVNLDSKAQQLMTADSKLTYGDAVSLAMTQLGMN